MKQIRNSVVCGIIVPQYVALNLSMYGFTTRVTFPIKADMVSCLRRVAECWNAYNGRMEVIPGGRGVKIQWYVAIERTWTDLNKLYFACYEIAKKDCNFLKVEMRQAKIHALTKEIEDINNIIY